ncbi:MAG: type II toxin-antitoxin system TacA family antitoxin [Gemmobacter sp.]
MSAQAPRETLNIRIRPDLRNLIDRAAGVQGKTRTDFVLEASRRAAEEALLDQTGFAVSVEVWQAFLSRLDAPPEANDRLRKTMQTRAPWQTD